MGRNPGIRESEIYEIMKNQNRPVWTAKDIGDAGGVSRVTASKRLKEMADDDNLETIEIGNATVYYLAGLEMKPTGDNDLIKQSLRQEFEDKFIGLVTEPWETGADKPVEPGDRVQIQVDGEPGRWTTVFTRHYDNRRKELHYDETIESDTQALISGEVYEKPTTPIEHTDYPDDYDLEEKIGAEIVGDPPHQGILATGFKNYLIRPANDAKFIRDIEIEWVSPGDDDAEREPVALVEKPDDEGDFDPDDFDPEEMLSPTYADIVMLSGDCEPRRAYIDEQPENGGYRVIPADVAGDELGPDYEPTDQFKREVREKTAVDGELQFERTWLEE
jgi:hypothetical protein